MLTETKRIDKVEIIDGIFIQVRESNIIEKDGEELAKTYHRWSFAPGQDVSEMPEQVQAIAKVVWTDKVIEQYKATLEQNSIQSE